MFIRYADPGLGPDDVEQTGEGAKTELPSARIAERHTYGEEPPPSDWVTETDTDSNSDGSGDEEQ